MPETPAPLPTVTEADAIARLSADLRLACMRISRRVRFESGDDVAPHQFSVLCRLEHGTATPGELAGVERISKPAMTRILSGLAERGLVAREDDPSDGRQILVSLTPEGSRALEGIRASRDAWMVSRVAALTAQERDVLVQAERILAKVAAQ